MFELFMLLFIIGLAYLAWILLVAIWPYLVAAVAVIIILNVWAHRRQNRKIAPERYQRPRPVSQSKPPLPPTETNPLCSMSKLPWVRNQNPALPSTETNKEDVPAKPVDGTAVLLTEGESVTCHLCRRDIPIPAGPNVWCVCCPSCRIWIGAKPKTVSYKSPDGTATPVTSGECVTCFSCNLQIPLPENSNAVWVQCPSCRDLWLTPLGRKTTDDQAKRLYENTAVELDKEGGEDDKPKKRGRKKGGKWVWYGDYLESWTWKRKRGQALKRDQRKCVHCGKSANQVHHTQYAEKLGTEPVEWLESVCTDCHRKIHGSSEEDWKRRVIPTSRNTKR